MVEDVTVSFRIYIMRRFISGILLKTSVLAAFIAVFSNLSFAQTCEAVPRQILIDLLNQADLSAVAAQYGLEPTPIDSVGTPPTYQMRFKKENTQTPCQVAAAMQGDARI